MMLYVCVWRFLERSFGIRSGLKIPSPLVLQEGTCFA